MKKLGTVELKTERLILRRFREADAELMYANWASDPEVTRYLTWTPHESVDSTCELLKLWAAEYEDPNKYNWAIEYSGSLIGNISLVQVDDNSERGAIGYCMAKKYWGKGIMTEALREVLRFCFEEVGFYRIEGAHAEANVGSSRVMEKCGLRYEGTLREHFKLLSTGERANIVQRAILRGDYFASSGVVKRK